MSSATQKKTQRTAPWRNVERHYCAICNVWMGSDRQSILLHENGKKHRENVERSLVNRRNEKLREERDKRILENSLRQMEQAAAQSHLQRDPVLSNTTLRPEAGRGVIPQRAISAAQVPAATAVPLPTPTPSTVRSESIPPAPSRQAQKDDWQARKRKRTQGDENEGTASDADIRPSSQRKYLEPGEGHYEVDGETYLEGNVFGDILEEDMPIQLWTGNLTACPEEKRLPERQTWWKNALVAAVTKKNTQIHKVHVTFLSSPDDTEETLLRNIPLDRIRIILGADRTIPDTLEEARLLQMGGEVVSEHQTKPASIDEATGLSGWSTVSVKRTTQRQELKEERARLREKRDEENKKRQAQEKELQARRMEEAKVANADDSALGAYDVWGRGGYRGVDIAAEDAIKSEDTAKSLASKGAAVQFKKKKRKPSSSRTRRTTSADDDE